MARRIVVEVKVKLVIEAPDGFDEESVNDAINELDYGFFTTDDSDLKFISEEIIEQEIISVDIE